MTKTRARQTGPLTGLIAQVVLLTVLAATAGLGTAGWTVGIACAVTIAAALAHGLARVPGERLGAGVLGDARPGHARRRRRRAGGGLASRTASRSRCS